MTYDVSFTRHDREGVTSYSWFVFDIETGQTLHAGFQDKHAALAWAMRIHGLV